MTSRAIRSLISSGTFVCLTLFSSPPIPAQDNTSPGYDESRFEATVLAVGLPRPLELDVASDGRVFFVELAGKLKVFNPETKEIGIVASLDVFADQENGLLGLALDPNFDENGWIYLMYSPKTEVFPGQHISRFTLKKDTLDLDSEKLLLKFEEQRERCCHHAGSLEFGPDGCLFISTGDNTHPFGDSASYAPLDERPGRHAFDAQDSAGNTADLRGKILRIKPTPEGGFTIPEGNLFPGGGPIEGRPEIYVMGCRNPWRMNVDQKTGFVYWGEVGPDARKDGPRGPRGYDELNQARRAGNFGWPFFIGRKWDNKDSRLLRVDYYGRNRPPVVKIASGERVGKHPFSVKFSGKKSFDKDAGQKLSYRWSVSPGAFPEQSTPEAEFTFSEPGEYLVTLAVRDDKGGENTATNVVRVGNSPPQITFAEPADGGFFQWGKAVPYKVAVEDGEDGNSDENSGVMKLRFLLTQRFVTSGPEDAEVAHLGGGGKHAAAINTIKASDCFNCHAVEQKIVGPAFKEIAARYAGDEAAVDVAAQRIIKGSSKVWGDVPMLPHAQFSDAEARGLVRWIFSLKDAESSDAASQLFAGSATPMRPDWMAETAGGIWEWEAAYTDFGAAGATPLARRKVIRLRNYQVEGEDFTRRQGTMTLNSDTAAGGQFIGSISSGHHLVFDRVNLAGIKTVTARVASPETGGKVQLRRGSTKGSLIAEIDFPRTGGWESWVEKTVDINDPGGIGEVFCIFINPKGRGPFMNLDWLRFEP